MTVHSKPRVTGLSDNSENKGVPIMLTYVLALTFFYAVSGVLHSETVMDDKEFSSIESCNESRHGRAQELSKEFGSKMKLSTEAKENITFTPKCVLKDRKL